MLDDIIEVVLELILDVALGTAGSKKVSQPTRIIIEGIVLVFGLGLIGLLFWVGINTGSTGLMILAGVLLVAFGGWVFLSVHRHRRDASQ